MAGKPDSKNVSVGKPLSTGGIYSAPTDATLPTDAKGPLDAKFVNLGYAAKAGVVNSIDGDVADIEAWGGDTVLSVRTSRKETFKHTFIETNEAVLKEVYGPSNVKKATGGDLSVLHNAKELPNRAYAYEILLTGDRVKRIIIPEAKITEIGDVTYVDDEAIGYEVTLTAFPDSEGNTAYEYIAKLAATPGA